MSSRQRCKADFKVQVGSPIDPQSNIGTEGILVPPGYNGSIPELHPEENPLPKGPRKPYKREFKTEEAREEHRAKRNEYLRVYRARKREEKLAATEEQQHSSDNNSSSSNNNNNQNNTKSADNRTPKQTTRRVTFAESPVRDNDSSEQLPTGYSYAEPYTADSRYRELQEQASLDEEAMVNPLVDYLQSQIPGYRAPTKSSRE